jgi:TRAP-type uncharacterized transport system substrate-binding protein
MARPWLPPPLNATPTPRSTASEVRPSGPRIALGALEGSAYDRGVAAVEALNSRPGAPATTVLPTASALDALGRLLRGEADVAIVDALDAYEAAAGMGEWSGRRGGGLRLLWVGESEPWRMVVSGRRGLTSLEVLRGQPVYAGPAGSVLRRVTDSVLRVEGVTPGRVLDTPAVNVAELKVSTTGGFAVLGAQYDQLAPAWKDRALAVVELTPRERETLRGAAPWVRFDELPADERTGLPSVTLPVVNEVVVATTRLTIDQAEELTTAAIAALARPADASGRSVDVVRRTARGAALPLHPGAAAVYRQLGAQIPDSPLPTGR